MKGSHQCKLGQGLSRRKGQSNGIWTGTVFSIAASLVLVSPVFAKEEPKKPATEIPRAKAADNEIELRVLVRWVKPAPEKKDGKFTTQVWIKDQQYETKDEIVGVMKNARKKVRAPPCKIT